MEYLYDIIGNFFFNIYQIIPDYGFAIIILTILIKSFLLPVAIKQQKAMVGMQKVQPHIEEIRKKYKNDPAKLNEETMKLYKEHKVNPLGGCLPALVQLPVIIVLYQVITKPLSYILKFTENEVNNLVTIIKSFKPFEYKNNEIQLIHELISNKENLNFSGVANLFDRIEEISNSMKFLNIIDLGQTPLVVLKQIPEMFQNPSLLLGIFILFIPILATYTTYVSSKLMSTITPSSNNTDNSMNSIQNSMLIVGPFMTLFFTMSFPAGLGLYFLVSNLYQMIQQYLLNKFIPREVVTKK